MTEPTLTGHCCCGTVHYRCGAPLHPATLCHCESCRRVAGAHAVAWLTVAASSLVYTHGEPAEFSSSARARRSFCRNCGTPLTYRNEDRAAEIDITLVTLDQSQRFQAEAKKQGRTVELVIHRGGKHGWLSMVWDLRQFANWFDHYLRQPAG